MKLRRKHKLILALLQPVGWKSAGVIAPLVGDWTRVTFYSRMAKLVSAGYLEHMRHPIVVAGYSCWDNVYRLSAKGVRARGEFWG